MIKIDTAEPEISPFFYSLLKPSPYVSHNATKRVVHIHVSQEAAGSSARKDLIDEVAHVHFFHILLYYF